MTHTIPGGLISVDVRIYFKHTNKLNIVMQIELLEKQSTCALYNRKNTFTES